MSDFHGGFLLQKLNPDVQSRLVDSVRFYLNGRDIPRAGMAVAFATRRGCPVTHCAVRGGPADGKGYATFHQQHAALGAQLAHALRSVVWAYTYENQSGSEMVAKFEPNGELAWRVEASWDQVAEELGLDDSDEAHERLMAELPLGRLAAELGVGRELLDRELAYDTPAVRLPLTGPLEPDALARYLGDPPG